MTQETKTKISEAMKKKWATREGENRSYSKYQILWVEANKVFYNTKEAARFFGCSTTAIFNVVNNKQKTLNGVKVCLVKNYSW